jgi:hypothetical protein
MPINVAAIGSLSAGGTGNPSGPISPSGAGSVDMPTETLREYAAWAIGLAVIAIFGISVLYMLHLGSLLFTKFNASTTQDFAGFVSNALDPFLKECATTLATIFGSTLGFVFGYYFKATSVAKSSS